MAELMECPAVEIDAEEPPVYKLPNVREVPEHLIPRVMAIIEGVNKRAAKIGAEPFKVSMGAPYDVERKRDDGVKYFVSMVSISIEGGIVKVPGFELIGRVDFEDGMILVNARPGAEIPARYRCASPACDHCQVNRQRNAVFIFKADGGDHIQVGRSCLQDFMGYSPEVALWAAREWGSLFADIDEEIASGGGSAVRKVLVADIMLAAVVVIKSQGFVSRKMVEESDGRRCASSSEVDNILFGSGKSGDDARKAYQAALVPDDKVKAAAVVAWVLEAWGGLANASDYQYNAVELCKQEAVNPRRIGLLVSLVASYNREMEERVIREKRVNAWIGKPGDKVEFEAVYAGENWFDTAYGRMVVARFDTPAGLVVYKGGTPFWEAGIAAGTPIKFLGTIKAHEDYKGTKQTIVIRCKVGGQAPKITKKAAAAAAMMEANARAQLGILNN